MYWLILCRILPATTNKKWSLRKLSKAMSGKSVQDQSALDELREKIDGIDVKLVKLLSERAQVVVQVGRLKRTWEGEAFYRPAREAAILRKIIARNPGPLPKEEMVRLFREIMSACMTLEPRAAVAYCLFGPRRHVHSSCSLKAFWSFRGGDGNRQYRTGI